MARRAPAQPSGSLARHASVLGAVVFVHAGGARRPVQGLRLGSRWRRDASHACAGALLGGQDGRVASPPTPKAGSYASGGGTRRVRLVREGGTRRVQIVPGWGGGLRAANTPTPGLLAANWASSPRGGHLRARNAAARLLVWACRPSHTGIVQALRVFKAVRLPLPGKQRPPTNRPPPRPPAARPADPFPVCSEGQTPCK